MEFYQVLGPLNAFLYSLINSYIGQLVMWNQRIVIWGRRFRFIHLNYLREYIDLLQIFWLTLHFVLFGLKKVSFVFIIDWHGQFVRPKANNRKTVDIRENVTCCKEILLGIDIHRKLSNITFEHSPNLLAISHFHPYFFPVSLFWFKFGQLHNVLSCNLPNPFRTRLFKWILLPQLQYLFLLCFDRLILKCLFEFT